MRNDTTAPSDAVSTHGFQLTSDPPPRRVKRVASGTVLLNRLPQIAEAAAVGDHDRLAAALQGMVPDLQRSAPTVAKRIAAVLSAMGMDGAPGLPAHVAKMSIPALSLDDIALPDAALACAMEIVKEYRSASELSRYGLEPRSRVVLWGPQGNGKARLAAVLASELGIPMIEIRYQALATGEAEALRWLGQIEIVAQDQPCLVLFDESTLVSPARAHGSETSKARAITRIATQFSRSLPSSCLKVISLPTQTQADEDLRAFADWSIELPAPTAAVAERLLALQLRSIEPGLLPSSVTLTMRRQRHTSAAELISGLQGQIRQIALGNK